MQNSLDYFSFYCKIVEKGQVGKTWLAMDIARSYSKSIYLNYDNLKDRKIIKNQEWLEDTDLLILDELHKMKGWKNFIKGVFDTKPKTMDILVTGRAFFDR